MTVETMRERTEIGKHRSNRARLRAEPKITSTFKWLNEKEVTEKKID